MGIIANKKAVELFFKIKQKLKEKMADKKNEGNQNPKDKNINTK